MKWIDVQEHVAKLLNSIENVIFVTTEQMLNAKNIVDEAVNAGLQAIIIPSNLYERVNGQVDNDGTIIRDLSQFSINRSENFVFKFIPYEKLTVNEQKHYSSIDKILSILSGKPYNVKEILISESMQRDDYSFMPVSGLWNGSRINYYKTI